MGEEDDQFYDDEAQDEQAQEDQLEDLFHFDNLNVTERTPTKNLDNLKDVDGADPGNQPTPQFFGGDVIQDDPLSRRQLQFEQQQGGLLRDQSTQNPSTSQTPATPATPRSPATP